MKRAVIFTMVGLMVFAFAIWYIMKPSQRVFEAGPSPLPTSAGNTDRGTAKSQRQTNSNEPAIDPQGPQSGLEPRTGAERLRAEYSMIVAGQPALTNLYDSLALLSGRDPFDSDLFGDACLFLSARSSMIQLMELDSKHALPFRSRMDRYPETEKRKIEEMMGHFERSARETGMSLTNALESLSRIFADRFEKRHGMNGEATVNQILTLGLPPGLMVRQEMPCP